MCLCVCVRVCVYVCVCVYGLTIIMLVGKASRLTKVFFA